MIEFLFLLCFSLHNLEEALWLPKWSKYVKKYHKEVSENEFRFAVIFITAFGYLITFQHLIYSSSLNISKYIYFGFILMMVLNVIFPHLILTIVLKKYAAGIITGLILNAPIGIYLLAINIKTINEMIYTLISSFIITIIFLIIINILFKIWNKLLN